ncbi:60S ribosomal protein L32 [Datura stramonium]|uniref:60S ribosomal protein L32 n=1 Tax=Datura stramonium TaxID=4076 RepID=A0ABS8VCG6_DATST|nr:60S ribosomal protein L32 [Datura stramonium]
MEPPELIKVVGRPKKKRDKIADEAIKRKGEWSSSRKVSIITCSKCGEQNHNARGYKGEEARQIKKNKGKEKVGQSSTESQQSRHTSRTYCYEPELGTQQSQQSASSTHVGTQQSSAYGPEIGDDEDPSLRPRVVSKELTLQTMRKTRMRLPTGSTRIQFTRDSTRVSTPTNLPYSPTKVTWKGKEAITSNQLQHEVRKKRIKMIARKGLHPAPDDYEI